MTREDARLAVNRMNLPEILGLEKSKGGLFCCPSCGSGTGKNHTGALKYYEDTHRVLCFSCDSNGGELGGKGQDVLGALRIVWRCSEDEVFEKLHITIDGKATRTAAASQPKQTKPAQHSHDHSEYYSRCLAALQRSQDAISFLQARGISVKTAMQFGIGFDPDADPACTNHKEPRIIIPVTREFYVTRAINPNSQIPKQNCKGGKAEASNIGLLNNPSVRTIFICEGWADALSIAEAGCNALWLNSTSNADQVIDRLKERGTSAVLLLCLDNDTAGHGASERLEKELRSLQCRCINVTADVCGDRKDPNDALCANRDAFIAAVRSAEQKALLTQSVQAFDEFMMKIQSESYRPIKTGMQSLDNLLGGGIMRQGLVILTAAPGAGKTTFTQMCFEEMAKGGTDVIFLNLEMSREQLLARSLSRLIWKNRRKMNAAAVMRGYEWTEPQRGFVMEAAAEYRRDYAPRMNYNPTGCGTSIESIMDTLNNAGEEARKSGKPAPVVVLDYLHLVTAERKAEPSEILKQTVSALKGYAIRYDTFVFAISASNRQSNSSGIQSLESGRDTSAIEYSADTVLALNFKGLAEKGLNSKGKPYSAADPDDMAELLRGDKDGNREMIVQVLKNRMTAPGGKLYLSFNPAASTFVPIDKREPADTGSTITSNEGWTEYKG